MRESRLQTIVVFSLTLFVTSCGFHEYKTKTDPLSGNGTTVTAAEKATFKWIKSNIIDPDCISCHAAGKKAEDYPFTSYGELMDAGVIGKTPESSPFYMQIEKGKMPPKTARMPDAMIDPIKAWITNGALQN